MRARVGLGFVGVALALGGSLAAGCSLLAPSDEEAKAGWADGSIPDGGSGSDDSSSGGSDGGVLDARSLIGCDGGAGCAACNRGTCAGCAENGTGCSDRDECCSGVCSRESDAGDAGTFCGAAPGQCTLATRGCTSVAQCCAGLTCTSVGRVCVQCKLQGDVCEAGTDCCSAACSAGACVACRKNGESCGSNAPCCGGGCHPSGRCR